MVVNFRVGTGGQVAILTAVMAVDRSSIDLPHRGAG
jgi:hypothetical protein